MLRRTARLLIAIALLVAQQVALGHQIWHCGGNDSLPVQSPLCEQHETLATVVGALECASLDIPVVATHDAPLQFVALCEAFEPRLVPASRGPPETLH